MKDTFYGKAYYNRPKCLPSRILKVTKTVEKGTCHGKHRSFGVEYCVYYEYPEWDDSVMRGFYGDVDKWDGSTCIKCDQDGAYRMQVLNPREEMFKCIFCGHIFKY